jgi:hypothetical protein
VGDLHRTFRAIVIGLSAPAACLDCEASDLHDGADADATSTVEASADAIVDGPAVDSYVDWCEAGPPDLLGAADSCHHYFYVPCGLPTGDVTDDSGVIDGCDQICLGFTDDQCAVLPPPWPGVLLDAGLYDAALLTDGGVFVLCACVGSSGRMPEGLDAPRIQAPSPLARYFAQMAHLEAASILAFARMHAELSALGAPEALLASVRHAVGDERRHARVIGAIAHRFGGRATAPRVRPFRKRTVEAIARENAVEGCARETYGALVATWQAHHASDPMIRRAMRSIAADETRHAELARATARFLSRHLDTPAQRRVECARRRAITGLNETAGDSEDEIISRAGVPSAMNARRLLDAMARL